MATPQIYQAMTLSWKWKPHQLHRVVCLFFISAICHIQSTASTPSSSIAKEVKENPSYWLKNTHSTTCHHSSVRTFKVDSQPATPMSLVIRQDVQGSVKVMELENKPASNHKIQVALNWTASTEGALNTLNNGYEVIETADEKIVLIEVFVGDVESATDMSPVVVGCTVAGFFLLLALIIVALYMARRNTADPRMDPRSQTSRATSEETSMRRSLLLYASNTNNSDDIERKCLTAEDEEEDAAVSDYPDSSVKYMSSQAGEDMSLNLSLMQGSSNIVESSTFQSIATSRNQRHANTPQSSMTSLKARRRASHDSKESELPPPPPPPPSDFDTSMICPRPPSYNSEMARLKVSSDTSQSAAIPLYVVPNKKRQEPPATAPKPSKGGAFRHTSQSAAVDTSTADTDTASDTSRSAHPSTDGGGRGGGGGGYLGSSLLGRTVMIVTVLCVITQATYSICHDDITVQVLIYIPSDAKISRIELFSNKLKPSVFEQTDWYRNNRNLFRVIDVDDASPTENEPCTVKSTCPTAANQSLLTCDWVTQKCACSRGWQLNSRQVCVDVNECEMGRCPPEMECTNLAGSYSCKCLHGNFWNGHSCQSCSVGCTDGTFQSASCTPLTDRTCSPCSVCDGGTFTYRPCSSFQDSQCMVSGCSPSPHKKKGKTTVDCRLYTSIMNNITNPDQQNDNAVVIQSNQVEISSQPNVFIEELHKVDDLSRELPVADNRETNSFVWNRESGIRIFIYLSNFSIIPEFKDVDHENDNSFVRSVMSQSMSQLNLITYNYCRSPVPDYYMLTMNKYRDRTTVLRDVVCNTTLKNCPPRFTDGQIYRFRTFNTKCPKTTIEVNRLNNDLNSVLCNERTPLLSDIFNGTIRQDKPLTFPSLECKQSIWRCKECFNENKCGNKGTEESCCAVGCHAQRDCKIATSDDCSNAPVECATGDTIQFLVQPSFQRLDHQFLCHIERVKPESVFTLSYEIQVPTPDGWNSSRRTVELPTAGESEATLTNEFLTIKYNNFLQASMEEMMLRGDYNRLSQEFDFSLFSFKPRSEFNQTKIRPVKYETLGNRDTWNADIQDTFEANSLLTSDWLAYAAIQNERPFDISTLNFNSKHGCYADTSKMHGKQLMYDNSTGQHVQVFMQKNDNGFKYKIRSEKKVPTVDLSLPGSRSVMEHYFPNSTLVYNTVKVELIDVVRPFYQYAIKVAGWMTTCNSYLSLSVFDKTTESVVATYDTLVYCTPDSNNKPTFEFYISIPETGSRNKLFAVTLKDSYTAVTYFVTTYSYSTALYQNNTVSLYLEDTPQTPPTVTAFILLGCLMALTVAFAITYLLVSHGKKFIQQRAASNTGCKYTTDKRRLLIPVYCILKVVYSLAFSLTVFILLLNTICSEDMQRVAGLSSYHLDMKKLVEKNILSIGEFKTRELDRQHDVMRERSEACHGYAQDNVQAIANYLSNHSKELVDMKNELEAKKFELLMTEIQQYLERTKEHVDKHKKLMDIQITNILTEYNTLLQDMMANGWLAVPLQNFQIAMNQTSKKAEKEGKLSRQATDFLSYIGVDRPSSALVQIKLLATQLDYMYKQMIFEVERNAGLGVLEGLDTSSLSQLLLRKYDSKNVGELRTAEFAIGEEATADTAPIKAICWMVVIVCDIMLFSYRMSQLSNGLFRLRYGYAQEVEITGGDKSAEISRDNTEPLQMEMKIIKQQIGSGDSEMNRSLLADCDNGKEKPPTVAEGKVRKSGSRAQSDAESELEMSRYKQKFNSLRSGSKLQVERPNSAMSEPAITRKNRRKLLREQSIAHSEPPAENSRASTTRMQKISIQSLEREKHGRSKSSVQAAEETACTRWAPSEPLSGGASHCGASQSGNFEPHGNSEPCGTSSLSDSDLQKPGWQSCRISKILLSRYATPAVLLLAGQVLAVILIFLAADLITYNTMLQLTSIDSMISHIGAYASVVNSYLTTHAFILSQRAQTSMVDEFNLHLHHIAKVKALFESDMNWSLQDYSNKLCVLDGKLVEHCGYTAEIVGVSILPCQSFPIEAVQYTDDEGLNAKLITSKLQLYTESVVSLITTAMDFVIFYINAVIIMHIITRVLYTILHRLGAVHLITVHITRRCVPVLNSTGSKNVMVDIGGESVQGESSVCPSDYERVYPAELSRQEAHSAGRSVSSRHSTSSKRHVTDDDDSLLNTIKAHQSVGGEQTSEEEKLLPPPPPDPDHMRSSKQLTNQRSNSRLSANQTLNSETEL